MNGKLQNDQKFSASAPADSFAGIRQGEPLPRRVKVLSWGDTPVVDGSVVRVNETTAKVLPENQKLFNWPTAQIDIEHATVPGNPLFKAAAEGGRFPVLLGWGTPVVFPGDGLYLDNVVWSPESKRAYEFPDLSAAVKTDPDGTVIAVHSLAFCCHGMAAGVHAYSQNSKEGTTMDKIIRALLGLPETAPDADVQAAAAKVGGLIKKLAAMPENAFDELSQCGEKVKTMSQTAKGFTDSATELGKRLTKAEDALKTLSQNAQAAELRSLLASATAKGKKIPSDWSEKYGHDLKTLSQLLDQLPENVVPVTQLSQTGLPTSTPASGVAARVAALFGHKVEDLK